MAAPRNANIKEKILQTTAELLQTTSFESVTLAGIATAAEISKGTLYYYYSSKDDILLD
ncbi:MAG: TetR/AcrR family transcriptional regulator, partial [Ruthenibacterium sp.]